MNSQQKRSKKQKLINLYGPYCWWCGKCSSGEQLTIEHLFPKSRGGSNSPENLRLACEKCNKSRGNSLYPPNWKQGNCL